MCSQLHVSLVCLVPLQAILPANFSRSCVESSDCLAVDEFMVMATYFSPASRSVPVILAVVHDTSHLLADDPMLTTDVISGAAVGWMDEL